MKVTLIVFGCLFIIRNDIFVTTELFSVRNTTPEDHRFMALVSSYAGRCPAVLITRQHLITPASCVAENMTTTVTLGFEQAAFYLHLLWGVKNIKMYETSRILRHEQGDIAIVELEQPITYTEAIQPVKLISEEEEIVIKYKNIATVAEVIGWHHQESKIEIAVMEVMEHNACDSYVGTTFIHTQQWCTLSGSYEYECTVGNVMTFNKKVAGLMSHSDICPPSLLDCNKIQTFSNIVPYLKWISKNVGVSVKELTDTELDSDKKLKEVREALTNIIKELDRQFQQEKTYVDQKLEEILGDIKTLKDTYTELDTKIVNIHNEVKKMNDFQLEEKINQRFIAIENSLEVLKGDFLMENTAISEFQAKIWNMQINTEQTTKLVEHKDNFEELDEDVPIRVYISTD